MGNNMKRNEMLDALCNMPISARATVITFDMGLEYEWATPEGHGSALGMMGDWPCHMLSGITPEFREMIVDKLRNDSLSEDDIVETELGKFYRYAFSYDRPHKYTVSEVFKDILSLTENFGSEIYCLCDSNDWEPVPKFFANYADMAQAFAEDFIDYSESWEECSDSELKDWYRKYKTGELSGLYYHTYSNNTD